MDAVNNWTVNKKINVNPKKTKNMIFNFINNYKFSKDF